MDYGETSSLTSGRYSQNSRFRIYIALFALWNILLFSLAVSGVALARKNHDDDSDSSSTASTCITSTIPLYGDGKYLSLGTAVSLKSDDGGSVRVGGGTTIYKRQKISDDMGTLSDFVIVDIDTERTFLAFSNSQGYLGYAIGVLSADQVVWNTAYMTQYKASHLASGTRVGTNFLIIGSDAGIITVETSPNVTFYITPRGASDNTQVCTLDSNAFAVSYPLAPTGMLTFAGTISGSNPPVITWTNNTIVYVDEVLSAHTVTCFEPEHYLVSYVQNSAITSWGAFFQPNPNVVSLTVAGSLPGVTVAPFITSATLKSSLATGGLLYIDANQNNALVATTVSLSADLVQYGSSLVINSGGVIGNVSETKVADIAPFGDQNGFVVTYSDWANQDRVTILIGQITESNGLVAASPAYVISPANTNLFSQQYWTNIVQVSPVTFVSVFALMNGTTTEGIGSSTGQVFNAPVGIIMELLDDNTNAVIGVSGQCIVAGVQIALGNYYYCDSMGSMFVRNPSDTPLYEYLDVGNVILSKNNMVGVGLSETDVLIKTTVY